MKMNKKIFGLTPSEAVRHDSRLKHSMADGTRDKKAFLASEEKASLERQKFVNKDRRRFLDLIGKAGVSLQALGGSSLVAGAFASRNALAAEDFMNKNVVFVYVSQGAPGDQWLPDAPNATRGASDPYRDNGVSDLMAFRHVNVEVNGHASGRQALGDPQLQFHLHKPTVDMRIAEVIGGTTPYGMMYLGANALMGMNQFGEPKELLMISDAGIPVDGPRAALNQFFNSPPAIKNDNGPKQLIAVQERAVNALKSKLGADEYSRIQSHLDALTKLESRIVSKDEEEPFNLGACNQQGINLFQETLNQGYGQADVIASAFACGLTKVAVLQVGDNKAHYTMPGFFDREVHGDGSHSGNYNDFISCCRGHQTVPAYMLKKLKDTTGADGKPLIDNTVFVVTNCMGDGREHTPFASPWGMATRMSGFQNGFSKGDGGNCRDFISAIPVGMGLPDGMYTNLGGDPSRANILA